MAWEAVVVLSESGVHTGGSQSSYSGQRVSGGHVGQGEASRVRTFR